MKRYALRGGLGLSVVVLSSAAMLTAAPLSVIDLSVPSVDARDPPQTSTPAPVAEPVRPGNPLWAVPLKDLSVTRERPIFSPSRRPPMSPVAAPPYVPPPPRPAEPQRPQLALVGTVVNAAEGFGIFVDQAANTVVRLKPGEAHDGWTLHSVQGREATLQKNGETAVLALPARDAEQTGGVPPVVPSPPSVSPPPPPVSGVVQPLRRISPRVHHGPDD
jgi:hypothetical protein